MARQRDENEQNAVRRFQEFHREEEPGAFPDVPEKSGAGEEEVFRQLLRKYNLSQEMLVQKVDRSKVADLVREFIRETGVSGRQVTEMAGMNRERVRRMIVSKEPSPVPVTLYLLKLVTDYIRDITPDVDSHNGGVWKAAGSVEDLGKKSTRWGTYDINLNRIGD